MGMENTTDLIDFHDWCIKLEADNHAMQSKRMIKASGMVFSLLDESQNTAHDLDIMKKHVFYGHKICKDDLRACDGDEESDLDSEQKKRLAEKIRLAHAVIGLITEADEMLTALWKYVMNGEPLDRVNVLEECCDATWYINLALDSVGFTAADVPRTLRPKLEARYERKFDAQKALNRNLEVERACLEASASGDTATPSGDQEATGG